MKFAMGLALLCAPLMWGQDYPAGPGKWKYPGLWLKVTDEAAPAGGVTQIHITLTEPKPIIRTRADLEFDESMVDEIVSMTAFSERGEAVGTCIRTGNILHIEAISPTGELGNSEVLPVFTATVRLREDIAPGTRSVFRILPQSTFIDANGADWVITDNAPGSLTAAGTFTIEDVIPGAGMVRAGTPIRILGQGFRAWSKVEIYNAPAMKVTYVSETELQVTLEQDFQIDQRRVEVTNPDLTQRAFYPHARNIATSWSAYDLLTATVPMFSPKTWSIASVVLPESVADEGKLAGVALQNPSVDAVVVRLSIGELATSVTLLPGERLMRSVDELFPGFAPQSGMKLAVEASAPVQVLGLIGDSATATVLPILTSGE